MDGLTGIGQHDYNPVSFTMHSLEYSSSMKLVRTVTPAQVFNQLLIDTHTTPNRGTRTSSVILESDIFYAMTIWK